MVNLFAELTSTCSISRAFPPKLYNCIKHEGGQPKIDSLQDIPQMIANVIQILIFVAGIAAALFIIYAGIVYVTSQGQQDRLAHAKNIIANAVVGIVIAVLVYPLVLFIARAFS